MGSFKGWPIVGFRSSPNESMVRWLKSGVWESII
jgi:hypothetical protein